MKSLIEYLVYTRRIIALGIGSLCVAVSLIGIIDIFGEHIILASIHQWLFGILLVLTCSLFFVTERSSIARGGFCPLLLGMTICATFVFTGYEMTFIEIPVMNMKMTISSAIIALISIAFVVYEPKLKSSQYNIALQKRELNRSV